MVWHLYASLNGFLFFCLHKKIRTFTISLWLNFSGKRWKSWGFTVTMMSSCVNHLTISLTQNTTEWLFYLQLSHSKPGNLFCVSIWYPVTLHCNVGTILFLAKWKSPSRYKTGAEQWRRKKKKEKKKQETISWCKQCDNPLFNDLNTSLVVSLHHSLFIMHAHLRLRS